MHNYIINTVLLILYVIVLQLVILLFMRQNKSLAIMVTISILMLLIATYTLYSKKIFRNRVDIAEKFIREHYEEVPQPANVIEGYTDDRDERESMTRERELAGVVQSMKKCDCKLTCKCPFEPDTIDRTYVEEDMKIKLERVGKNSELINGTNNYSSYQGGVEPSQQNNMFSAYGGNGENYVSSIDDNITKHHTIDQLNLVSTECKPECCGKSSGGLSCSRGCICMDDEQTKLVYNRGMSSTIA
jgi:hypothetical protein